MTKRSERSFTVFFDDDEGVDSLETVIEEMSTNSFDDFTFVSDESMYDSTLETLLLLTKRRHHSMKKLSISCFNLSSTFVDVVRSVIYGLERLHLRGITNCETYESRRFARMITEFSISKLKIRVDRGLRNFIDDVLNSILNNPNHSIRELVFLGALSHSNCIALAKVLEAPGCLLSSLKVELLDGTDAEMIVEACAKGNSLSTLGLSLSLINEGMDNDCLGSLHLCTRICSLFLGPRMSNTDIIHVAHWLKLNKSVDMVELRGSDISYVAGSVLLDSISLGHTSLSFIDLGLCSISFMDLEDKICNKIELLHSDELKAMVNIVAAKQLTRSGSKLCLLSIDILRELKQFLY
jgi:hypothetical protein